MLAGHQVLLETDDSQGRLDKYGRELVYVWVDGQLFNLEMIKAGFAHEYTYDAPYRYQQQFKEAERAAADAGVGLGASNTCGGDTTRPAGGCVPGGTAKRFTPSLWLSSSGGVGCRSRCG